MKKSTYIVRFGGGSRWVDLEMPRVALHNPRIFARWFKATSKRYQIDLADMPLCKGISQIAAGYGYRWHHVEINLYNLYWGRA